MIILASCLDINRYIFAFCVTIYLSTCQLTANVYKFYFFVQPEVTLGVFSSVVFFARTVFKVVILHRDKRRGVTVTQQNFCPSFVRKIF